MLGSISGVNGATSNTNVGIGTASPTQTLDVVGNTLLQSAVNSTTAFQVQNASGATILSADTTTNTLNLSGNINLNKVSAPTTGPTTTVVAGTTLGIGNYYYVVSFVTPSGQTSYGPATLATTTSGNQAVNLTAIPTSPSNLVTARDIYRTDVNGLSSGPFYLLTTINDNTTTTYSDTTADSSLGVAGSDINNSANLQVNGSNVLTVSNISANTAVGINNLQVNTTGYYNTALGSTALQSNTTGYQNTALGYTALMSNTTGVQNTALGSNALEFNTTGYVNTAVGNYALQSNTTGNYNTALGLDALQANTTGYWNVASGVNALAYNTTGNYNVAYGVDSLEVNTTGSDNSAYGTQSLFANTTGSNNIAFGYNALLYNTTGYNNSALGSNTLQANTTGIWNTALGNNALQGNTTGGTNTALGASALLTNTTGYQNTASGVNSLYYNTTGYDNTATGYLSLQQNTTGIWNTALGNNALQGNTTGNYNIGIGGLVLNSNTTGNNNTALGFEAGNSDSTGSGNVFLGYQAGYNETGSNLLYIANSSTTTPLVYGNFATPSLAINGQTYIKAAGMGSVGILSVTNTNSGTQGWISAGDSGCGGVGNVYLGVIGSSGAGLCGSTMIPNLEMNTSGTIINYGLTSTGATKLQDGANSTTAFTINNSSGGNILNVNSNIITNSTSFSGWTTASGPAIQEGTSVTYNGYVYVMGGISSSGSSTSVYYDTLNSNGTIGSWNTTTALPNYATYATSVTYNGYVYVMGGQNPSSATANTYYAPINSNGTLGAWSSTTALPVANMYATSVTYNGMFMSWVVIMEVQLWTLSTMPQ